MLGNTGGCQFGGESSEMKHISVYYNSAVTSITRTLVDIL